MSSSEADSIFEQVFQVDEHGRRQPGLLPARPSPLRSPGPSPPVPPHLASSTTAAAHPVRPPLRPRVSPQYGHGAIPSRTPSGSVNPPHPSHSSTGERSGPSRSVSQTAPSQSASGQSESNRPRQPLSPVFRLNQDLLDSILPFLHPASLASLACTCVYFSDAVRSYLGFASISLRGPEALSAPLNTPPIDQPGRSSDRVFTSMYIRPPASSPLPSPSSEHSDGSAGSSALTLNEDLNHEVPLGFPRKLPHNGSVQIGTKIYAPLLGARPVCNVLDLAPLRADPRMAGAISPGRLPQWVKYEITVKDMTEPWAPLVAPCTAVGCARHLAVLPLALMLC